MRWRLFQSLEQRIKTVRAQHMDFVDQIDFEATTGRRILDVIEQLFGIFETGSTGRINLNQIDKPAFINLAARRTFATWLRGNTLFAVQTFGQNSSNRGLPYAASAGKQISMVEPIVIEGIHQRLQNMNLPHQLFKIAGTPFARKHLITHVLSATISFTAQREKVGSMLTELLQRCT